MGNLPPKIRQLLRDLPRAPLYALFYIVYALSFLSPRSQNIWLFDEWHGMRFADNPRYLFLYIHERQPRIKAIWIAHSRPLIAELRLKGLHAHHAYSLAGLWYTLRARVVIFESTISVFFWLTGGMIMINLWHGIPIKKVVYDSVRTKKDNWVYTATGFRRLYHTFFHPEKVALGDYVLAQSPAWKSFLIVENQPRNLALIEPPSFLLESERILVEEMQAIRKTKKILTYLPTFRDGSDNPLQGSGIDFHELDRLLGRCSVHLYIKMHHERNIPMESDQFRNVSFLPIDLGVMQILRETDALITDYSSVYFEFLVADRPIIFFAFDFANYQNKLREMYFDYETITPGPKVRTFGELCREIERFSRGEDEFAAERTRVRTIAIKSEPEKAREKLYGIINGILSGHTHV